MKVTPQWLLQAVRRLGGISAALFVLPPNTRKVLIPISRHDGLYTGLALYVVASLVLAWLMSDLITGKNKGKS